MGNKATPRRIEVVLFDLGDTLMYFDGDWDQVLDRAIEALRRSLIHSGLDLGEDFSADFLARINDYYRQRELDNLEPSTLSMLAELLKDIGCPPLDDKALADGLEAMHSITQAHWIPETDALETLERLQQERYRMGLISNAADDPNTQVLVDKVGARRYFEKIVSSAELGIRKPDPRIFEYMLDCLGIAPERAVMVGDMLGADILGAQRSGIFSIWITRRANKPANSALIGKVVPDAQIAALSKLPALLDGLAG